MLSAIIATFGPLTFEYLATERQAMKPFTDWLIARLGERSTWAGIATLVASMTFLPNASTDAQIISLVGAAIAGSISIAVPDKKSAPLPTTVQQMKGPQP